MEFAKISLKKLLFIINIFFPKKNKIFIKGSPNAESSAITIANYLHKHYSYPIIYSCSEESSDNPDRLLNSSIDRIWYMGLKNKLFFFYHLFTSKYVFFTHTLPVHQFSKRQIVVNIWHGVLYKKLGVPIGGRPILADTTVGTSELTRKMFAEAFGVSPHSIFISGYPRNDRMLTAKKEKSIYLKKMGKGFGDFEKIIIWLPTYRQRTTGDKRLDGKEVGNPFYIPNFEIDRFNEILKRNKACCIVKPHPLAVKYEAKESYSNLRFIDDKWLTDNEILLYELIGVTDLLISDVSSVVIDYLLMDQPIMCMSTDFDEYREKRGFYFADIENWLPSLIRDQEVFFNSLEKNLIQDSEDNKKKRQELKEKFFKHYDTHSTKRLVQHVFKEKRDTEVTNN